MRIIQSDVIGHFAKKGKRHSVYSVDFQPNGNRVATAGADCSVKIWSVDVLLKQSISIGSSPTSDLKSSLLLCTLTNHSKSVNIVRWSKDGKYLASAGDDNYICVHVLSSAASFAGFGVTNIENWMRCYTLVGHSLDILDIDWWFHGVLASGSVDNRILLWNLHNPRDTNTKVVSSYQILAEHKSFVKGLSFDPIGKYLISCDAANSVIIWSCDRDLVASSSLNELTQPYFTMVRILTDPLKGAPECLFHRVHWSSDGTSVCLTSAMKSGKPIGMVLSRNDWKNVADLVGHQQNTIATRFSPSLLQITNAEKKQDIASLVALGDQDGVLSIWSTQNQRALVVLSDLFSEGITDISWQVIRSSSSSSKGLLLSCASLTGEILFFSFEDEELGKVLTEGGDEVDQYYFSLYGKTKQELDQVATGSSTSEGFTPFEARMDISGSLDRTSLPANEREKAADVLLTNPMVLQYLQPKANSSSNVPAPAASSSSSSSAPVKKTVAAPTLVDGQAKGPSPLATAVPTNANGNNNNNPLEKNRSALLARLVGEEGSSQSVPVTSIASPSKATAVAPATVPFNPEKVSHTSASSVVLQQQKVMITQQGKKRIRPVIESVQPEDSLCFDDAMDNSFVPMVQDIAVAGNNQATTTSSASSKKRIRFNDDGTSAIGFQSSSSSRLVSAGQQLQQPQMMSMTNPAIYSLAPSLTVQMSLNDATETPIRFQSSVWSFHDRLSRDLKPINIPLSLLGGSHSSSAASSYSLLVEAVNKPHLLQQLPRNQIQQILKLSLYSSSFHPSSSSSAMEVVAEDSPKDENSLLWSTILTNKATRIIAVPFQSDTSDGIVVVAGSDGTLSLLDLSTGISLVSNVVVGSSIVFLDSILMSDKDESIEHSSTVGSFTVRILAMTTHGKVFVYDFSRSDDHKTNSTNKNKKLRLVCQIDIQSIVFSLKSSYQQDSLTLQSSRSSSSAASVSKDLDIQVEKCSLNQKLGVPLLLVKSRPKPSAPSTSSSSSLSADGLLDYSIYQFDFDLLGWQRIHNSKYFMSSLFLNPQGSSLPACSFDFVASCGRDDQQLSLQSVQQELLPSSSSGPKGSVLTGREILQISKLKMLSSTQHPSSSSNGSSAGLVNVQQWSDLLTISHAEERLNAAIVLGNEKEIFQFFRDWLVALCQAKYLKKLESFLILLIDQLDQAHYQQQIHSSSRAVVTARNIFEWIEIHQQRNSSFLSRLLQEFILPVLATIPDSSSQSFFQDAMQRMQEYNSLNGFM